MVGNIPNFSRYDIIRCFLRLGDNIGRKDLANKLSLGEGTIRSILEILKGKNFLNSTKKGHFLSNSGKRSYLKIASTMRQMKEFELDDIYPEYVKVGLVLKNTKPVEHAYLLRDIAVKNGSEGALILRYSKRLEAPEASYQKYFKKLEKIFDAKKGDLVIISFSGDSRRSEIGALAIASELNNELRHFLKRCE